MYVSEISYGTMFLGGAQFQATNNPVTAEEGKVCLEKAIGVGMNYIDSADIYGAYGPAETIVGNTIKDYDRSELVIATKACIPMSKHANHRGLSRKHLFDSIQGSLQRLQTTYVDLYYCHRPDYSTQLIETVRTMNYLIDRGQILHWGTSNWPSADLERAFGIAEKLGLEGPVVDQSKYNLYTRSAVEQGLPYTIDGWDLGIVAYKVLSDGVLTGMYDDVEFKELNEKQLANLTGMKRRGIPFDKDDLSKLKKFGQIAKDLDIKPSQLAYAWTLSNSDVSSAIMSTRDPKRIEENIVALDVILSVDVIEQLDELFPLDNYYDKAYNSNPYYKMKKYINSERNEDGLIPPSPGKF
ncbi:MAG: L-glyceraldehyde 3-phosphate reductase [Candidatus Heimdallarchaeota archaeon LC_2]|nr:MAG: L-glyceraldehyde 3-phosphate reductase [Candidatus Heimdallarchaeota archaeon LC_2]